MSEKTREPPMSHRLGKERQKRFDAFLASSKRTKAEALNHLIDIGLLEEGYPAPGQDVKLKRRWAV